MGRDVVTECLRVTISNELPHLCHVILSQIGIDDEIFRKATVRNVSVPLSNHLQTLDLSHNPLSEKSIKHLSSIIARLPALQQLNLDGMFFIYKCMHVSVHSPPSTYQFMNVCMNVCLNACISTCHISSFHCYGPCGVNNISKPSQGIGKYHCRGQCCQSCVRY